MDAREIRSLEMTGGTPDYTAKAQFDQIENWLNLLRANKNPVRLDYLPVEEGKTLRHYVLSIDDPLFDKGTHDPETIAHLVAEHWLGIHAFTKMLASMNPEFDDLEPYITFNPPRLQLHFGVTYAQTPDADERAEDPCHMAASTLRANYVNVDFRGDHENAIRDREMTEGEAAYLPPPLIKNAEKLLTKLRAAPHSVKLERFSKQTADGVHVQYGLVIKDPALQDTIDGRAKADVYERGLQALSALAFTGHPTVNYSSQWQFHIDTAKHSLTLLSPLVISLPSLDEVDATVARRHMNARIVHDPAHILACYLVDNGVNFPGSEKLVAARTR